MSENDSCICNRWSSSDHKTGKPYILYKPISTTVSVRAFLCVGNKILFELTYCPCCGKKDWRPPMTNTPDKNNSNYPTVETLREQIKADERVLKFYENTPDSEEDERTVGDTRNYVIKNLAVRKALLAKMEEEEIDGDTEYEDTYPCGCCTCCGCSCGD